MTPPTGPGASAFFLPIFIILSDSSTLGTPEHSPVWVVGTRAVKGGPVCPESLHMPAPIGTVQVLPHPSAYGFFNLRILTPLYLKRHSGYLTQFGYLNIY